MEAHRALGKAGEDALIDAVNEGGEGGDDLHAQRASPSDDYRGTDVEIRGGPSVLSFQVKTSGSRRRYEAPKNRTFRQAYSHCAGVVFVKTDTPQWEYAISDLRSVFCSGYTVSFQDFQSEVESCPLSHYCANEVALRAKMREFVHGFVSYARQLPKRTREAYRRLGITPPLQKLQDREKVPGKRRRYI